MDWTENQGLFAFVRVYNAGSQAVTIAGSQLSACGSVDVRCESVPQRLVLQPRMITTIATVASADQRNIQPFSYRYTAAAGAQTISRRGSSAKTRPDRIRPIPQRESGAALEVGVNGLGAPGNPPVETRAAADLPPRLLKRGSSRLAIGHKGVALVRVLIAANGTPRAASVISISNRLLSAAAIETAASSTYAPATKAGRPVSADYVATFSFDGEDPADAAVPVWKRSVPIWRRSPASTSSPTPPPATSIVPEATTPSSAPTTASETETAGH